MNTPKWFDLKFDFSFGKETFQPLLSRLQDNIQLLRKAVLNLNETQLCFKPNNSWSIKEHIGHLIILESLWQKRFVDIQNQKPVMSPADLNNKATDDAVFNQYSIDRLLTEFVEKRTKTLYQLSHLKDFPDSIRSLHPRLNQEMRVVDLMYFVAEHDEHHIHSILQLVKLSGQILEANTIQDIERCSEIIFCLRPQWQAKDLCKQFQLQFNQGYRIAYVYQNNQAWAFVGYRMLDMLHSGKTLYIDDLCTLPQARKHGYASLLLDWIKTIAYLNKVDTISLDSGLHRSEAHKLYFNKGFKITDYHFEYLPK